MKDDSSYISLRLEDRKCKMHRARLVCVFKQLFLVFKQYFMYFNVLFHLHIFPQIFLNNNFQFLNICTKRIHSFVCKVCTGKDGKMESDKTVRDDSYVELKKKTWYDKLTTQLNQKNLLRFYWTNIIIFLCSKN